MSQPKYKEKHAKAMQKLCLKSIYKQKEYVQKKIQQTTTKYKSKPTSSYRQITLKQNHGKDLRDTIRIFQKKAKYGCIFVCSSCQQTNFEDNVIPVKNLGPGTHCDLLNMCLTGHTSIYNIEYLCLPCKPAIYNGRMPKLSIKNNYGFPPQPDELKLYPVEEQIISPLMPFMTIIELPIGGQQALKGSICHVPVDMSPTVNS